jgi:hypothetical protein
MVAGHSQQKVNSDKILHTIPSRATNKMVPFILYFLVGICSAFSWPPERLRVEKVGSFARWEVDGQEPVPPFNSVKGLIRTQKLYNKVQEAVEAIL